MSDPNGYRYLVSNVGVEPVASDPVGYRHVISNIGIEPVTDQIGHRYLLVGDVEAEIPVLIAVWSGSAWVDKPLRYWNGAGWINPQDLKYWDGSAWVST